MPPPSPPPPPPQQQQQDDIMIRRREKRRHLTSHSMDLRDPYSVIALAIRFDESMDDESLLQVPLESGPIYNPKAFANALLNLQKETTIPAPRLPTNSRSKVLPRPPREPKQAITPVILSGLVAAIQDQNDDDDDEDNNIKGPSAIELVAYCRSMRRAALTRLRLRRQRRRVQRNVTPFVLLGILLTLVVWSTSSIRMALDKYGFVVGSCQSSKACRLAATRVWEYCDPSHRLVIPNCKLDSCPVVDGQLEYPLYAMHTLFRVSYMRLSEIDYPRKPSQRIWPLRRQQSSPRQSEIRWLGETVINRIIRETLSEVLPLNTPVNLLDAGCGIGGTLYAMLDSQVPPTNTFSYHGIALSAPEIIQARQYLALHELDAPEAATKTNSEIMFEQRDYDEPFHQTYNVIVAVESLAFSPNISHTLHNMASALQSKGVLIIMEDIISTWVSEDDADELRETLGTPSLMTYPQWEDMILSVPGLRVHQNPFDLTIEFDMSAWLREEPGEGFLNAWSDWRYRIAQHLVRSWTAWFGSGGKGSDKDSPLPIMQLVQNLAEKTRSAVARQQAYRRADLSYFFIVVSKK